MAPLYIPIWYNSSNQKVYINKEVKSLYIPIWYNSSFKKSRYKGIDLLPLHSNLVQFKHRRETYMGKPHTTLHSNLVQFKLYIFSRYVNQCLALHSNLVQFKRAQETRLLVYRSLYIPIWYNSSDYGRRNVHPDGKLYIPIWYNSSRADASEEDEQSGTLHSNLVQFKLSVLRGAALVTSLYIPIWYNSSQFLFIYHLSPPCTLHSNLVQFKPSCLSKQNPNELYFTFQSGTIQARRTAESCFQCFQLQFLSTMII